MGEQKMENGETWRTALAFDPASGIAVPQRTAKLFARHFYRKPNTRLPLCGILVAYARSALIYHLSAKAAGPAGKAMFL
jgi:spermidine synthase